MQEETNTSGENASELVNDLFNIESHVLSTRSADAYKAVDKKSGSHVLLWLLRQPLQVGSDAHGRFKRRMESLKELGADVVEIVRYGIDRDGTAFAVLPAADGYDIISGNIDSRESERRTLTCVKLIGRLHDAGLNCGDICGSSFWVTRDGSIRFIGLMGIHESAAAGGMSPPMEVVPFIAPEQRAGGDSGAAGDVFSLGALIYFFLTGQYPYGQSRDGAVKEITAVDFQPVSALVPSPPVWADELCAKCLNVDPSQRYQSANEISGAMNEIRRRALDAASIPAQMGQKELETQPGTDLTADVAQPQAIKKGGSASKIAAVFVISFVVVAAIGYLAFSQRVGGGSDNTAKLKDTLAHHKEVVSSDELRDAIDVLSEAEVSLDKKALNLQRIVSSDDPLAHDILVKSARDSGSSEERGMIEKAIIDRARRLGLMRSAEQVKQWLRTIRFAEKRPAAYEAILSSLDTTLPEEARNRFIREAYPAHNRLILKLAVALALDSQKVESHKKILSQLIGDSLQLEDAAEHSALALILAHRDLAHLFGEDVIQLREQIPDRDLVWLLRKLGERNDLNVRSIAGLAIDRGAVSPIRAESLKIVRDREDLGFDVLEALVNAGTGEITGDDISTLGKWFDADSKKVLMMICADSLDQKLLVEAFDTLAGKSVTAEPAATLIEWVRTSYWDRRGELVNTIGILSALDVVGEEAVSAALNSFEKFARDSDLIDALLESKHPVVVRIIVEKYKDMIGLGALINLLSNPDKDVRISAVRALKGQNDVGALKLIIDRYEREKVEEVREAYRENHWTIRERGL